MFRRMSYIPMGIDNFRLSTGVATSCINAATGSVLLRAGQMRWNDEE
jgi:hypothetical protein